MKKVFKATFFRIMLLALLLFIFAYYVFVYINTIRTKDVVFERESLLLVIHQHIEELHDLLDLSEVEKNRGIMEEIELWQNSVTEDEAIIKAYKEADWTTLLEREIQDVGSYVNNLVYKNEYYSTAWPTLFTLETRLEQHRWIRDKGIVPVLRIGQESWLTIYDTVFSAVGAVTDEELKEITVDLSQKYSSTGIYYLNHIFNLLFSIFGAGFLLFLFGDVLTKEGLGRNGSIHFLHTQPIQRDKITVSKFLTVLILSVIILIGAAIISLLLGTVFDWFGNWNYPVLIYGEEYSFTFMNMSTFIFKSTVFFFMVLLFCYSLLFLYSIITKRALVALGLTLTTIFIGISLSEESVLSAVAPYIPFHYFSVPEIITMEMAATLNNFNFSFTNGSAVLGMSSAILLAATYLVSRLQFKYR